MSKVAMFHGAGGTPDLFWFPSVRSELEKRGFEVWAPQLPEPDDPRLDAWLPVAASYEHYDSDSILIGHSAGCPLILALLEQLQTPVKQAILVAGFAQPLDDGPEAIVKSAYDWERIRNNVSDLIFINSDNDPWGCNDVAGRYMFDRLGGTLILRHGEGHMGSEKFDQPYRQFPLLLRLVD